MHQNTKSNSPIIGVTTGELLNLERPKNPFVYGQGHDYTTAIELAGGIPFLIPSMEDTDAIDRLYELMDGILLAGGNDVNPELFEENPHPAIEGVSRRRDTTELHLIERARSDKKPILGICRGTQIWNIAQGGSLLQHLPDHIEGPIDHINSNKDLADRLHLVDIDHSSHLAKLLLPGGINKEVYVDSHHHQAINRLGRNLKVVSKAKDGVIEAIETDEPEWFAIGVQWHPESMYKEFAPLFEEFILASSRMSYAQRI